MATGRHGLARDLGKLRGGGLDSHTLRHEALARLRHVVPVDAYCFSELDPESQMMVAHATEGIDRSRSARLYLNEYAEADFLKQRSLLEGSTRACSLSQATHGEPQRSVRFRELLAPMGVGHELRAACVQDGQAWGFMNLYRARGRPAFTAEETEHVAGITPLLAELLCSSVLDSSLTTAPTSRAPVVVVLDRANRIAERTGEASDRLEALKDPEEPGNVDTPEVLKTLAARARAPRPDAESTVTARVRGADGAWLALHASPTTTNDGDGDRVAVVIEPVNAPDLRLLIVASLGLTPGERRVTDLVVRGLSTKQIAGELYLSPYTVQDRLKVIFQKAGVRSRRELVAHLR